MHNLTITMFSDLTLLYRPCSC